jgi:hypothetical protein
MLQGPAGSSSGFGSTSATTTGARPLPAIGSLFASGECSNAFQSRVEGSHGLVPSGGGFSGTQKIPDKCVAAAVRGEYVDLTEFLPTANAWDGSGNSLMVEDGRITVAPKKKQAISNFDQWLQAFTAYEYVLVGSNPSKFAECSAYRQIIQRANKQFLWPALCTFDMHHRITVANDPGRRLDNIDPALYAQILNSTAVKVNVGCFRCKDVDHVSRNCPFGVEEGAKPFHGSQPFRSKGRSWSESGPQPSLDGEICNNFNKSACYYRYCKRLHICKLCRGQHAANKCSRATNHHGDPPPGRR